MEKENYGNEPLGGISWYGFCNGTRDVLGPKLVLQPNNCGSVRAKRSNSVLNVFQVLLFSIEAKKKIYIKKKLSVYIIHLLKLAPKKHNNLSFF